MRQECKRYPEETVDLLSLCGIFKPSFKGVTLADMEEAIRQGATEE